MARLILWLLIGGLVWWMWRSRHRPPPAPRASTSPPPEAPRALTMLRCSRCDLHLPAADVVSDAQGLPYCCPAHRDLGPTRKG